MRFSELTPGDDFPESAFVLDAATVTRYLAATDDDNALYWRDGAVQLAPPLAVAALSFRDIAGQVALEPGSLHTGQELTFHRPVLVGERLTARARVTAGSRRRGFTALVVDLAAIDAAGMPALSGRMTLMVAGAQERDNAPDAPGTTAVPGIDNGALPIVPAAYAALSSSDLTPGRDLGALTRTVTQERIDRYAEASGDHNPIHLDPRFAARSPFGTTVAHGMLLLAYVSTSLTRTIGLAWVGGGALKARFRQPALAGATVTVRGRVDRVENGSDGVQYAVCAVRLEDSGGEALITGDARVPVY